MIDTKVTTPIAEMNDLPAEFYVLSQRAQIPAPAIGCIMEFEDVLCDTCGAALIAPGVRIMGTGLGPKVVNRLRPVHVSIPSARTKKPQVLIVTGLFVNVLNILHTIPHWRSRFDVVCAYVMDAFGPIKPRYANVLSQIDCLFVPMSGNLEMFRSIDGVTAEMVPYACDVARFGVGESPRLIDVIGYGRQLAEHSRIIEETYNAPSSPRMYFHTSYFSKIEVKDHRAQRALFWKILKRSKVALAYDMLVATRSQVTFSLVAQRWFECLTAGCAIVGRRPTCPEAAKLLDWEDATIEVPDETNQLIPFLEDLFRSPDRLDAIHARNRRQAFLRHDWRHRIDEMLRCLDIPRPARLDRQLEQLKAAASDV